MQRVPALTPNPEQVATSFNDWLQDTLLVLSERWPALEGGVRLDVRPCLDALSNAYSLRRRWPPHILPRPAPFQVTTVDDVVVSDVGTLEPYRAALRADDEVPSAPELLTSSLVLSLFSHQHNTACAWPLRPLHVPAVPA